MLTCMPQRSGIRLANPTAIPGFIDPLVPSVLWLYPKALGLPPKSAHGLSSMRYVTPRLVLKFPELCIREFSFICTGLLLCLRGTSNRGWLRLRNPFINMLLLKLLRSFPPSFIAKAWHRKRANLSKFLSSLCSNPRPALFSSGIALLVRWRNCSIPYPPHHSIVCIASHRVSVTLRTFLSFYSWGFFYLSGTLAGNCQRG